MKDILSYESEIWACADLLISSGIKQSKFPDYMMPFFALIMLEGRMRNEMRDIQEAEGIDPTENIEDFVEAFRDRECGYNDYIVRQNKTLSSICDNDKTFEQDFSQYLAGFDAQLKELLGIERGTDDSKYLNLDGMVAELRKKGILMQYITGWAQIDLSPYNNSEITTLEEHIKRKWADISAETAGEQYTPEDIISLIAEIVAAKIDIPKRDFVHLYDPTCGGANLLFGVADRLREGAGYEFIAANGCDWNDALYALAKIESLFRDNAEIKYGNTLTSLPFNGKSFDVVVANPPYGIPWKGYEKEIRDDQTGQFAFLPSVSDGQLLFLQHNAWHLHDSKGIVVEVNNGSSLFSGDAGSGESNVRKYLFDNDWVEAIIQMPSDEFFNTGIVTYLWILNKNKSADRKDKVILINASDLWQPLKKNKGSKRKEMNETHRADIVRALVEFRYEANGWLWPIGDNAEYPEEALANLDIQPKDIIIFSKEYIYISGKNRPGIIQISRKDGSDENLGMGCLNFSISRSKTTGKVSASAKVTNKTDKDTEVIPYNPDPEENDRVIAEFLARYISKPYRLLDNTVGVEVNFNKEFYVPETVEPVDTILAEIAEIDSELATLEKELGL